MGSAKTSSSAARKERIAQMQRAERARERRNRIVLVSAAAVVVAALVVGGVVLVRSQSGSDGSGADAKVSGHFVTGKDGVRTWKGDLGRTHVGTAVKYPVEPPVGGNHNPVWQNCNGDVYPKPVKNENAVHSLEHGAVWVTYTSAAPKADVDALAAKVKKTPYTLMSPDDKQKNPIMLTAWGHQRTVKSASDPDVDKFLAEFVQGKQTPEPGAACTNGLGQ